MFLKIASVLMATIGHFEPKFPVRENLLPAVSLLGGKNSLFD
jgi:hypothetical protein